MRWRWIQDKEGCWLEDEEGHLVAGRAFFIGTHEQLEALKTIVDIGERVPIKPKDAVLMGAAPRLFEALEALLEHSLGRDVDQDWQGIAAIKEARAAVQAVREGATEDD